MANLPNLPESSDKEFWGDAEQYKSENREISICSSHSKRDWMTHNGYIDNNNGTISCKFCPWGTILPGYIKLIDGRLRDFRS